MQVVNFAPAAGPHSALRHHRTRLASAACLLHPRYMVLNPVIRRLRSSGARHWAAALGALVVLLGSGLPCACVCLAHDIDPVSHEMPAACHPEPTDGTDADHCGDKDHCPSPSICSTDQAPATAIESAWHGPTLEPLTAWQGAPRSQVSPSQFASTPLTLGAARSSPRLPAFAILRL